MPEKIDVAAQLDILIKLQAIDKEIYRLKAQKAAKPKELKQLEDEYKAKMAGQKQAEEKLTALGLKKKEK